MAEARVEGERGAVWPLIGRDAELAALAAALERGGAVVVGAAGVGKSPHALEAADRASARVGTPDGAGPVRIAGRGSAAEVPLSPFASILPSAAGVLAPLDAPAAVAEALAARWTGDGMPVLVVDDAQWLDPVSVVVVHQLEVTVAGADDARGGFDDMGAQVKVFIAGEGAYELYLTPDHVSARAATQADVDSVTSLASAIVRERS